MARATGIPMVLAATALAVACADIKTAPEDVAAAAAEDAGSGETGSSGGDAASSGGTSSGGTSSGGDGGAGPGAACRPEVLDCLDATSATVLEVPTEYATLQAAFQAAKANDVVQIKGASLGAGWRVPPYVTLRGCAGAKLVGNLGFQGSAGIVEGFTVTSAGSIVANTTGSFVVRQNRFVGPAGGNEPGVSGRSIDGIVSAQVVLVVEANRFEERTYGVEAATSYDTGTRSVAITIQNNLFRGVANPIRISEGGLVGTIDAKIEHDTFYDFTTAISLFDVGRVTKTNANAFQKGTSAIKGSPYEVASSFAWEVTTPAGSAPNAGAFAEADLRLVDAAGGDLRPGAGSPLVDAVAPGGAGPATDYQGCPRPSGPRADVSAYENP